MNHQQLQLADLARLVQGECIGQEDLRLSALASLEQATSHDLAFVNADKYVEQANQSQAGALIVTAEFFAEISCFVVLDRYYLQPHAPSQLPPYLPLELKVQHLPKPGSLP